MPLYDLSTGLLIKRSQVQCSSSTVVVSLTKEYYSHCSSLPAVLMGIWQQLGMQFAGSKCYSSSAHACKHANVLHTSFGKVWGLDTNSGMYI